MELLLARRHSRESWVPAQALMGRDRRIFQRVPLQERCQLRNPLFGLESEGNIVNLSLGGAGVVAPVSWPEGGRVRLQCESWSLEIDAIIVFRKEQAASFRYGLKFQDMSLRPLIRLRRLLRKNYGGPLTV
jgi:hypothetical protein